ncbi:hypothetical protein [Microvirga sp. Mcv34]|uniref:hypothetical protein n=1 Tax=Microvirga sp. Mcv34 TaxID=2926016 RepID=UPI0021C74446|nr:hypothetical protein [Microvirga sp. Mcv34]
MLKLSYLLFILSILSGLLMAPGSLTKRPSIHHLSTDRLSALASPCSRRAQGLWLRLMIERGCNMSFQQKGQRCCPDDLAYGLGANYIVHRSTAIGVAVLLALLGRFLPKLRAAFERPFFWERHYGPASLKQ